LKNKPYISEETSNKAFDYKQNSAYDVIKSENKKEESVIKNFDKRLVKDNTRNIIKGANEHTEDKVNRKNYTKTAVKRNIQRNNSEKNNIVNNDEKPKAFNYSEEKPETVMVKDNTVTFEEKSLKVNILTQDQNSALSYTTKEYLSDKGDFKDNKRSKLSEIAHKNTIKKMSDKPVVIDSEKPKAFEYSDEKNETETVKDNTVTFEEKSLKVDVLTQDQNSAFSYTTKEYLLDKADFTENKRSKLSEIAHKNIINEMSDKNIVNYEKSQAFNYTDENSKTAQSVKQEFSHNDVVKPQNSIPVKSQQALKDNKVSSKSNKKHLKKTKKLLFHTAERLLKIIFKVKLKIRKMKF